MSNKRNTKTGFVSIKEIIREKRNKMINKLYTEDGLTITAIADIFNIDESTVFRIVNKKQDNS